MITEKPLKPAVRNGAQKETRTPMILRTLAPEAVVDSYITTVLLTFKAILGHGKLRLTEPKSKVKCGAFA